MKSIFFCERVTAFTLIFDDYGECSVTFQIFSEQSVDHLILTKGSCKINLIMEIVFIIWMKI